MIGTIIAFVLSFAGWLGFSVTAFALGRAHRRIARYRATLPQQLYVELEDDRRRRRLVELGAADVEGQLRSLEGLPPGHFLYVPGTPDVATEILTDPPTEQEYLARAVDRARAGEERYQQLAAHRRGEHYGAPVPACRVCQLAAEPMTEDPALVGTGSPSNGVPATVPASTDQMGVRAGTVPIRWVAPDRSDPDTPGFQWECPWCLATEPLQAGMLFFPPWTWGHRHLTRERLGGVE